MMRHEIWQGLLDAARLVRYYEALYNRYQRWHLIVRVVLLASATGVIGLLAGVLPDPWTHVLQTTLGIVIVVVVIVDLVGRFAEKAAVLHTISVNCSRLDNEWHELWADCQEAESSTGDLARRNAELSRRLTEVTSAAGEAHILDNRRLNKRCWVEACRVEELRYA